MNARRPLACVAAVGALLALSACEKPAPIVTIVSGDQSVYAEASTWCFEGQTGDECAERETEVTSIPVRAGETVGIDVDKELADGGWYLELTAPGGEGEQVRDHEHDHQDEHRGIPPVRRRGLRG